jgi:hypothetical protein
MGIPLAALLVHLLINGPSLGTGTPVFPFLVPISLVSLAVLVHVCAMLDMRGLWSTHREQSVAVHLASSPIPGAIPLVMANCALEFLAMLLDTLEMFLGFVSVPLVILVIVWLTRRVL